MQCFVAEVTARADADLPEINRSTATLFCRKIRELIRFHLFLKACDSCLGLIPDMNSVVNHDCNQYIYKLTQSGCMSEVKKQAIREDSEHFFKSLDCLSHGTFWWLFR